MSSSYLPTGSTVPINKMPGFNDALAKAKEIAARLTGGMKSGGGGPGVTQGLPAMVPDSSGESVSYSVAPRTLKTTIEFIVPGYKVGLIIGTKGETLKRIEKITDTKITFDPLTTPNPADMPERRVYVMGLPEDAEQAKKMVIEKIEDPTGSHSMMGQTAGLGSGSFQMPVFKDIYGNPLPFVQFHIPNVKVGLVIGKGGETIRELQEKSSAKIFVAPDSTVVFGQTERLVQISGTEESISIAKGLIEEVLEGGIAGSKPTGLSYGQTTVTLTVPDNMVGLLIGKKGENFKNMIAQSRARIVIDPPVSNGSPTRMIYISGSAESVAYAQQLIHDKLSGSAKLDGNTYYELPGYGGDMIDYSQFYYPGASMPTSGMEGQQLDPASMDAYTNYYQQYYISAGYDPTAALTAATAMVASLMAQTSGAPPPSEGFSNESITESSATAAVAAMTQPSSGLNPPAAAATATVPAEQLKQYYDYYHQYYLSAGVPEDAAAQAANSALTAAGLPQYQPESIATQE